MSFDVVSNSSSLAFSLSAHMVPPQADVTCCPWLSSANGPYSCYFFSIGVCTPSLQLHVLFHQGRPTETWNETLLYTLWSSRPLWTWNSWILYHMNNTNVFCWLLTVGDPFDGGCKSLLGPDQLSTGEHFFSNPVRWAGYPILIFTQRKVF